MVHRVAVAGLLRGHVMDRPDHGAHLRQAGSGARRRVGRCGRVAGQAHVENFDHAVLVQHQITGLDVPMHDLREWAKAKPRAAWRMTSHAVYTWTGPSSSTTRASERPSTNSMTR